jgi:hypothetical protein
MATGPGTGSTAHPPGTGPTSAGSIAAGAGPTTAGPADTGSPDPSDASTGELLRALTDNVRSLVEGELRSARAEMTEKALAARPAAAMLGGAAVLGALAAGTSAAVLVRALDRFLPPTTSALVATALLGSGAAALASAGSKELRRIGPPVPERTVESVKADVAAVTDAVPGSGTSS